MKAGPLLLCTLLIFIAGCTAPEEPAVSIQDVTEVRTAAHADADLGVTPTVKRYDVAVFDTDTLQAHLREKNTLEVRIDGRPYLAVLEEGGDVHEKFPPGTRYFSGTLSGVEKSRVTLSTSDTAVTLWARIGQTDVFIDTTGTRDTDGRLLHAIYSSRDIGGTEEHTNLSGFFLILSTPTPDEMAGGDTIRLSDDDLDRYPVLARHLRYGGQNPELSNAEAMAIRDTLEREIVEYGGRYLLASVAMK
jgi:hypothetical protein